MMTEFNKPQTPFSRNVIKGTIKPFHERDPQLSVIDVYAVYFVLVIDVMDNNSQGI